MVAGLEPSGFDWHNVVFGREGRILDFMSALPQSRAQLLGVSLNVTNTEGSGNISWPCLVLIIRLLLLQAGLRLGQHYFNNLTFLL